MSFLDNLMDEMSSSTAKLQKAEEQAPVRRVSCAWMIA
jgi:hypothetical protein